MNIFKLRKNFCQNIEKLYDQYATTNNSLEIIQKQLLYRSKSMGMAQVDFLVGRWATYNIHKLNVEQCQQFSKEILQMETYDLWNILVENNRQGKYQEIYDNNVFIKQIEKFNEENPFDANK